MNYAANIHIIDILFYVGLFTQFTKVAEFILLPNQQKWVSDVCESITLQLHYMNPIAWFSNFKKRRIQSITIALGFAFYTIYLGNVEKITGIHVWRLPPEYIPLLLAQLAQGMVMVYYCGGRVANWMYSDGKFAPFLWKFIRFFIGVGLLFFLIELPYLASFFLIEENGFSGSVKRDRHIFDYSSQHNRDVYFCKFIYRDWIVLVGSGYIRHYCYDSSTGILLVGDGRRYSSSGNVADYRV